MTDESADSTKNHIPGKNGGRLRRGGTNKGGTGRPSNALRVRLDAIAQKFLKSGDSMEVAGNPDHPRWLGLGQFATEMSLGKATQKLEADVQAQIVVTQGLGLKKP